MRGSFCLPDRLADRRRLDTAPQSGRDILAQSLTLSAREIVLIAIRPPEFSHDIILIVSFSLFFSPQVPPSCFGRARLLPLAGVVW